MDYVSLIAFLVMQYLRPQEWSSFFNALRPVQVLAAISLLAIIQRRQPVRKKDLWSTPHDYVITAYFAWTVFASPTRWDTFKAIYPLIFFYFLGVLVLNTIPRLKMLLAWWAGAIIAISALAIMGSYGFDPFDSYALTSGPMKGRLVLNLSIYNNPNALAHAIVPVIPMLYYLLFWKRIFAKPLLGIIIVPATAVMMTESKGAFLSAAVTIFATLTFGRPKTVQITMAVLAAMFGGTMMYALPRMNELKETKTDDAIQGRVAAYEFGLKQMDTLPRGHGLGNFTPMFLKYGPLREERRTRMGRVNNRATLLVRYEMVHYAKAPHSAYVQNGADLGYTGFFLFIGILYLCGRTLITAKTANDDEELIRRTLFAMLLWYTVSSWMVDFCYRATFFFLVAATSAFHRHMRGQFVEAPTPTEAEEERDPLPPPWQLERVPPEETVAATTAKGPVTIDVAPVSVETVESAPVATVAAVQTVPRPPIISAPVEDEEPAPASQGFIKWNRLGLFDLAMTYALTSLAVRFWRYVIHNF